jgi:hypothetical protein
MPQLLDPFSKPKCFGFKARGLQDTCHRLLIIFGIYSKDKKRRFKTNLALSLILRFNLRLGGYSYGVRFSIAPHTKEDLKLFGA